MTYKKLLVPVDGSELTDKAIGASIDLALQLGAAITGFVAEPLPPLPASPRNRSLLEQEIREHEEMAVAHAKPVLERFEAADGTEGIAVHVRLSIPLGGRATQAHVGFCPAFVATPTVEVSTDYDGVEAVVTAAEILPWGVRIECRLSEPAEEPLEIPVTLVARSPR